ncbi:MAG: alpha/beta fold hydrolase [Spirochaetaceae bacterium]|nr:MAG: alpha/beta fold hydrolase [Spirochaetaceae bacterium]
MKMLIPALVLVFVSCTTIPVNEAILLQPKRSVTPETFDRLGLEGYTLEEHFFEADDGTLLNGWFVSRIDREGEGDGERITVVFFGGNGFYLVHSIQFLELYAAADVDVFIWDYRGYGLSDGEATLSLMKADALTAVDFTRDVLGARGPMIAHGHSIGSFVAAFAAEERGLDAIVLESPATNTDHWLRNAVPGLVRRLVNLEVAEELAGLDNIPRVSRFQGPSLFAVGEEDFVTPSAMAELLYESSTAAWKRLYIQPGGDHNSLPPDVGFRDGFRALADELRPS